MFLYVECYSGERARAHEWGSTVVPASVTLPANARELHLPLSIATDARLEEHAESLRSGTIAMLKLKLHVFCSRESLWIRRIMQSRFGGEQRSIMPHRPGGRPPISSVNARATCRRRSAPHSAWARVLRPQNLGFAPSVSGAMDMRLIEA
jgi:hypothetical protein